MLGKKVRSRFAGMSVINIAGLGLNRYDHYLPNTGPIGRGVRIDNSGSVRLTFDALDLYPQETTDLTEVRLFTNPKPEAVGDNKEIGDDQRWIRGLVAESDRYPARGSPKRRSCSPAARRPINSGT